MARALLSLFFPIVLAACGGTEPAISVATSSPASSAAPSGHRVPVATALDATDPAQAARSPLLAAPTAAPAMDHSHHHHGAPSASTSAPAPAMDHSHHHHGAPPASTSAPAPAPTVDHSKHNHGGSKP
jgi:hypothetical protein